MKRDWSSFHAKLERELGCCRVEPRMHGPADPAHVIARARIPGSEAEDARNCIPLCRRCHAAYDERRLDILPYLRPEEMAYAAQLVGLLSALERVTNRRWVPA